MKIRDLNLDDYVIVYDIGKSEHSEGMTVVGRVDEIIFNEDDKNEAGIDSLGNFYHFDDSNYFDLWRKSIEDKTERLNDSKGLSGFTVDEKLLEEAKEKGIDELRRNILQSNDVQQRKRNDTVNHPSHYNYGEIEVIDFIEQVTKHYNPNVAYHIGNAIKYLSRSPHKNGKEDVEKAKWYIERAFENWD
ncbi:DUF3310 domain-containing protein [Staphylococcus shinii]|uniref:DUF3310 domain-containing protein n=1 Tax=Staphylococcus shinii TaxID=2912228 RepID=UPI003F551E36